MSGAVLMNVTVDLPSVELSRPARVAYAWRALQLVNNASEP
jgi:hypothetical protein